MLVLTWDSYTKERNLRNRNIGIINGIVDSVKQNHT